RHLRSGEPSNVAVQGSRGGGASRSRLSLEGECDTRFPLCIDAAIVRGVAARRRYRSSVPAQSRTPPDGTPASGGAGPASAALPGLGSTGSATPGGAAARSVGAPGTAGDGGDGEPAAVGPACSSWTSL